MNTYILCPFPPGKHWIRGRAGPTIGLNVLKENLLSLPKITP